jgi:uncharacterized membrane protein
MLWLLNGDRLKKPKLMINFLLIVAAIILYILFLLTAARKVAKYGEAVGVIYVLLLLSAMIGLLIFLKYRLSNH